MSAWAKPGVKCVCIDGAPANCYGGWAPSTGGVYTVRGVYRGRHWDQLYLMEYISPGFHPDGSEIGWMLSRFRPLITRSQEDDVRLIKSLLVGDEVPA